MKMTSSTTERAATLLAAATDKLCSRTDRLFAGLMVFQYLGGIVLALLVSPRTWIGAQSQAHIHVWAAVILGGIITGLPVALARVRPGRSFTRHVIAAGQAMMGALLIHLSGGRIETHFHIFGSLAFLAFYRDWRVLVTASAIIAADHLVRGIYWPQSVFGVLTASSWRWVEHAGWVLFEDVFLIYSCVVSRREMVEIADRQAREEGHRETIEVTVAERTAELRSENQQRRKAEEQRRKADEQRRKAEEQRRKAEEHAREVLRCTADPIVVINATGVVVNASDSVQDVFGWDSEELVGQNISVLMPEPHRSRHDDYLRSHLATGKTAVLGKVRRLQGQRRDGTTFPIELTASRVGSSSGLFVGILRDLSARVQLEEELEGARRLEAIGQLAAGVAHEINTPTQYVGDNTRFLEESFRELAPLLKKAEELAESVRQGTGSSDLADELKAALEEADVEYLGEEIPRAIEQSLNGIGRVRKIVQSMKEFSHPGVEEMTSIDLHRAIETTITVATNEWKYVAEVETDFDPELPVVPCLPGEINQVVLNMIVNAAHAIADVVGDGEGGKGTITISTRRDGEFVEVRIADTGAGIPETAQSKIFEPFFTTKEVGKGTGQGLSIAHGVVVKKHGGTLDFETEIGKGTTFIIRLPLERSEVSVP